MKSSIVIMIGLLALACEDSKSFNDSNLFGGWNDVSQYSRGWDRQTLNLNPDSTFTFSTILFGFNVPDGVSAYSISEGRFSSLDDSLKFFVQSYSSWDAIDGSSESPTYPYGELFYHCTYELDRDKLKLSFTPSFDSGTITRTFER